MRYDELNYEKKKLQNIQKLEPSKENLQKIMDINKELEELEKEAQKTI